MEFSIGATCGGEITCNLFFGSALQLKCYIVLVIVRCKFKSVQSKKNSSVSDPCYAQKLDVPTKKKMQNGSSKKAVAVLLLEKNCNLLENSRFKGRFLIWRGGKNRNWKGEKKVTYSKCSLVPKVQPPGN